MVKTWNGVATKKGKKAVIAVRTAADIEDCHWVNLDADETKIYKLNDDDEVELKESDRRCQLVLDDVDEDEHAGEWEVTVFGQCDDQDEFKAPKKSKSRKGRRRKRRQAGEDFGLTPQQPSVVHQGGIVRFKNRRTP